MPTEMKTRRFALSKIWVNSFVHRKSSKCKGPVARTSLAYSRNRKKISVAVKKQAIREWKDCDRRLVGRWRQVLERENLKAKARSLDFMLSTTRSHSKPGMLK